MGYFFKEAGLVLYFIILFFIPGLFAQQETRDVTIEEAGPQGAVLDFSLSGYDFVVQSADQQDFFRIQAKGYYPLMKAGYPELPILRQLISVPAGANIEVDIKQAEYERIDLTDHEIAAKMFPYQPSHLKTEAPPDFVINDEVYQKDTLFGVETAEVEYLGISRDVAIARLQISPFAYNPQKNELQVLTSATIEIRYSDIDKNLNSDLDNKGFTAHFNPLQGGILNGTARFRDSISSVPAKYVIVSDTMFRSSLQPLVQWKTQKGFEVVEAYISDALVGNTPASIRAYLQGLYQNATPSDPAPVYVLIVGDVNELPTFMGQAGSHPTDMYYAEYTGDTIPDAFFGRFSATDTSGLNAQIRKTISYEKYLMPQPSYLNNAVLIAGADANYAPTHGNGQVNYIAGEYIHALSGFNTHKYLYPASSSQQTQIIQNLSDGFSIANYTAHGLPIGWVDPELHISDLQNVQNTGRYGLMIANACYTNQFTEPLSFGEAVMRLEDRGAIGYIGGSNGTHWDEDFYWAVGVTSLITSYPDYHLTGEAAFDLLFHTRGQPFSRWYTTQGQIVFAGNLSIQESGSSKSPYYWEIYNLMGDPSLMPYLGKPDPPSAGYNAIFPVGATQMQILTDPYASVALSRNDSLVAVDRADSSGEALLDFQPLKDPGFMKLVITSQNHQPYIDSIEVIDPSGPYIIHHDLTINDSLGNNNGKADYAEKIHLNQALRNYTGQAASNVEIKLSSPDTNITILDSIQPIGNIPGDTVVTVNNAFVIQVEDSIPDKHKVEFELSVADDQGGSWKSTYFIRLHVPRLDIESAVLTELQGNGNGIPETGETARLTANLLNRGAAEAKNVSTQLVSNSPLITVLGSNTKSHGNVPEDDRIEIQYELDIDDNAWLGTLYTLIISAEAGVYKADSDFNFMVGQAMEDFEKGDFSRFEWEHNSSNDWFITGQNTLAGSYSAKSAENLGNNVESSLSISMNVVKEDTLSFFYKVSSEEDFDNLEFYMDNKLLGQWSGDYQKWEKASFRIPSGKHTFTWTYVKDYSLAKYEDCAWIDNIIFPPNDMFADIQQEGRQKQLRIFPNPAAANLYIEAEAGIEMISLLDNSGRRILLEQPNTAFNSRLNTENLSEGLYILRVFMQDGSVINKKVIIK
ncbi:MAG: C25 family cysteine peptidase [Bacteroidales bacterium]